MLLAIDIGNTMVDLGLFEGTMLTHYYKTATDTKKTKEEYLASFRMFFSSFRESPSCVDGVIISSVVPPLTPTFEDVCLALFNLKPKIVGPGLKTGLPIKTDNPKEVGSDMICGAIAAKEEFGPRTIVADMGTATKLFLVDETGSFAGCTIGTGLALEVNALVDRAALLPAISLQTPAKILGKNTPDSMNSAFTYGTSFAISGLANAIEKEVGYPLNRVITGGSAKVVKDLLPEFDYRPNLTLDGLCLLYRRNQK